jgi:hypothetical protein
MGKKDSVFEYKIIKTSLVVEKEKFEIKRPALEVEVRRAESRGVRLCLGHDSPVTGPKTHDNQETSCLALWPPTPIPASSARSSCASPSGAKERFHNSVLRALVR